NNRHENARRGQPPGEDPSREGSLEHTEDDGGNKGESDIHGDNAQSAEERTHGHCECSPGSRRARTERLTLASRSRRKKSALLSVLHLQSAPTWATWLKTHENN